MSSPSSTLSLVDVSSGTPSELHLTPVERWDDLKKSSRRIEGLLYNKLTDFAKAIQQLTHHHKEEEEKKTYSLEKEIRELLTKVSQSVKQSIS